MGPIFKYFNLYHGGLAFTNTRTNFTFTTNYDSIDLNLFSSQLPDIVTSANGTKSLVWHSEGACAHIERKQSDRVASNSRGTRCRTC